MNPALINGLVGLVGGVLVAAITAWATIRRTPSKIALDAAVLVDAHGQVIEDLTAELARQRHNIAALRQEAKEANAEATAATRRVDYLEDLLIANGISIPVSG
ncbi:MAG: hypothetical protein GEU73_07695 [Chloroflexi bacterium]|nr:hypothetical protein [Chloroflexota bacterium]